MASLQKFCFLESSSSISVSSTICVLEHLLDLIVKGGTGIPIPFPSEGVPSDVAGRPLWQGQMQGFCKHTAPLSALQK